MSTQAGSPESSDPNPSEVRCDLSTTPSRDVRRMVRDLLAGRSGIPVDDAVQVTDELVSNAHQHGHTPRYCRVALINHGRRLRVEVDDTSPHPPRIRTPDRFGGRGLILVDRLASTWGVQHHPDHKTVWAELALNRPGSSGGHAPHLTATSDRQQRP